MVVVGSLVRCLPERREALAAEIQLLPGRSAVLLEKPGDLCVVLEGEDLAEVEGLLRELHALDGVLAAWPVYTHLEEPPPEGGASRIETCTETTET